MALSNPQAQVAVGVRRSGETYPFPEYAYSRYKKKIKRLVTSQ